MPKSNAERQRKFKKRHGNKLKRLDVLLPIVDAELLHGNAKQLGITKADYIGKLLRNNESLLDCDPRATYETSIKTLPDNNDYDGTTALNKAVAELVGCSPKNNTKLSKIIKAAMLDLGIVSKAKNKSTEMKLEIYQQIKNYYH